MYCFFLCSTVNRISQQAWAERSQSVMPLKNFEAWDMRERNQDSNTNTAFSLQIPFVSDSSTPLHITQTEFCYNLSSYLIEEAEGSCKFTYFIPSPVGLTCPHTGPDSGSLR